MTSDKSTVVAEKSATAIFLRVVRYLRPYLGKFALAEISLLIFSILTPAYVWLLGPILKTLFGTGATNPFDFTGGTGSHDAFTTWINHLKTTLEANIAPYLYLGTKSEVLFRIGSIIVIVAIIKNIFVFLEGFFMAQVLQGIISDVREQLYRHYQRLSLFYYHKSRTGILVSRITNDANVLHETVAMTFSQLIRDPLQIMIYFLLLIFLDWRMTLFTLVTVPPTVLFLRVVGRMLRRYSQRAQERMGDLNVILQETISGIRLVKAFGVEDFEFGRFQAVNAVYRKTQIKMAWTRKLSGPFNETLGSILVAGLLYIGGSQVLTSQLTRPEEFLQFIMAFFLMMKPARSLTQDFNKLSEGFVAARRVFEVLDTDPQVIDPPIPLPLPAFQDGINFRGVWFKYETTDWILKGIDFTVPRGKVVALTGPAGAGKSTLLDLVPRFYDPDQGQILLDGHDLREYAVSDLRKLMGIVTQETILFHDTVRKNIAYGLSGVSDEDIIAAAKVANAHDFVSQLEKGYDTVIGDRGTRLSGGEKQRIAIARAVLRNPAILIFDEATSSLDAGSERLVQEAIERLMANRTVLVIAHRLATIRNADLILVLDHGQVAESGSHDELLARHGLYEHLYNIQFDRKANDSPAEKPPDDDDQTA